MAEVRETITHLYSLGRFEDVRVEAAATPDGGVALRYVVDPIHTVTRVEFRGQLGLSEGTLRSRMVDRFGQTPPASRATDVAAALVQLYQERRVPGGGGETGSRHHRARSGSRHAGVRRGLGSTHDRLDLHHRRPSPRTGRADPAAAADRPRPAVPAGGTAFAPWRPGHLDAPSPLLRSEREHREAGLRRGPHARGPDGQRAARSPGDGRVHGRSAAQGQARRAGADRTRGLGGPGSARGLGAPHHRLPQPAGLLEGGGRDADAPRGRREADADLRDPPRPPVPRRTRRRQVTGNQSSRSTSCGRCSRCRRGIRSSTRACRDRVRRQAASTARSGFATAEIDSAVNEVGDGWCSPSSPIKEGPRVVVGTVGVAGNQAIASERIMPLIRPDARATRTTARRSRAIATPSSRSTSTKATAARTCRWRRPRR